MYLNLDLLYNVDIYLCPLFYYKYKKIDAIIYSPMTKKYMYMYIYGCKGQYNYTYYDDITNLCKSENTISSFNNDIDSNISRYYTKSKPFFLEKEHIKYLKSNERITEDVS